MTKPCLNNALILKPMIRWLCLLLVPAAGLVTAGCARQELIVARTGWLGLDTSLGHSDYDEGWVSAKPTAQDRQIYFDLMGELGVPMMRDLAMSWARVQPAAGGDYDYSLSDDLVRRAGTARIDLLAVCWGIPRWAATFAEGRSVDLGVPGRQHADEFGAFVRRFVERYDGDGSGDMPTCRCLCGRMSS